MFVFVLVFLRGAGVELVLQDLDLILEAGERALRLHVVNPNTHELPVRLLDVLVQLAVLGLHVRVELPPLPELLVLPPLAPEVRGVVLAELLQLCVAGLHALHRLLPLVDQPPPVGMELLEQLGRLVHLDLPRLRLRDLVREVLPLRRVLERELLDREREFPDLGVVCAAILFECELVLLLLPRGNGPLFELLLVPVHLEFELVELLVAPHELVGEGVDLVLGVVQDLLQAQVLRLEAALLPVGQRLQVLLGLGLVLLRVDQLLRVHELLLHVDEVLGHDLDPAAVRLDLLLHAGDLRLLPLDLRIELLVGLGGEGGQHLPIQVPRVDGAHRCCWPGRRAGLGQLA
mmetsp:Transcript_6561/g.18354  ORF Transcript_6561/g.18354 Transcript_6561/m.18354 type:complete len:346 (-) Transcript_6561:3-1040(-)